MHTDKLQIDRNRGDHARRILDDPLVVAAFADIEDALVEAFKASKPGATAFREDLWRVLDLSKQFRRAFEKHIRTGQIAAADLVQIEKRGVVHKLTEAMYG